MLVQWEHMQSSTEFLMEFAFSLTKAGLAFYGETSGGAARWQSK